MGGGGEGEDSGERGIQKNVPEKKTIDTYLYVDIY